MSGDVYFWISVAIGIAILIACAKGIIQTFRRNAIAAVLLLIFLFPVWLFWAIIETFRKAPGKSPAETVVVKEK